MHDQDAANSRFSFRIIYCILFFSTWLQSTKETGFRACVHCRRFLLFFDYIIALGLIIYQYIE